jgi:hypothetical protein
MVLVAPGLWLQDILLGGAAGAGLVLFVQQVAGPVRARRESDDR